MFNYVTLMIVNVIFIQLTMNSSLYSENVLTLAVRLAHILFDLIHYLQPEQTASILIFILRQQSLFLYDI